MSKKSKNVKPLSPVQQKLTDEITKSNAKRGVGIPMPTTGGSASVDSTQIIRVTKLGKKMCFIDKALPPQCQVICSLISQLESVEGEGCMVKDLSVAFQTWADTPANNSKGRNAVQDLHKVFNSHWASKMLGNSAWESHRATKATQSLVASDILAIVEYA
jgi:hypothetical protein